MALCEEYGSPHDYMHVAVSAKNHDGGKRFERNLNEHFDLFDFYVCRRCLDQVWLERVMGPADAELELRSVA